MVEPQFLRIPNEILSKLLEYTDFRDLHALQLTCRQLRDLVAGSTALQYIVALGALGMRGESIGGPSMERLQRLRAYEALIRNPKLKEVDRHEARDLPPTHVCGNVMAISHGRNLHVSQMPSPMCGVQYRRWTLNLDYHPYHLGMDPTQDLLLLVNQLTDIYVPDSSMRTIVHVLSLSTGERHPACAAWSGQRETAGIHRDIEICGTRIATTVTLQQGLSYARAPSVPGDHVEIWNWKTGVSEVVSDLPLARGPVGGFPGVKFLDECHILVLSKAQPFGSEKLGPHLQVYALGQRHAGHEGGWELSLCCRFLLPKWHRDIIDGEFLPSSGPCWASGSEDPGIFHPDRDRLLAFVLYVKSGKTQMEPGRRFFVPTQVFLRNPTSYKGSPPAIPWDAWGPQHAHIVEGSSGYRGRIYGMKVVEFSGGSSFTIFDHHPRRVARAVDDHRRWGEAPWSNAKPSTVIYGPTPRTGSQYEFLESLIWMGPPRTGVTLELPDEWRGRITSRIWLFDESISFVIAVKNDATNLILEQIVAQLISEPSARA